jgi:hypothetical protein
VTSGINCQARRSLETPEGLALTEFVDASRIASTQAADATSKTARPNSAPVQCSGLHTIYHRPRTWSVKSDECANYQPALRTPPAIANCTSGFCHLFISQPRCSCSSLKALASAETAPLSMCLERSLPLGVTG